MQLNSRARRRFLIAKWASFSCGFATVLHGAWTVAIKPSDTIGLWGVPEMVWAGMAVGSGLVCLLVSYSVFRRRKDY